MRWFVTITLVVLAMSTWMAGYSSSPQPVKSGVSDVSTTGKMTTQEADGMRGEFLIVDGYRPFEGADQVSDKPGSNSGIDFPQVGRFK